MVPVTSVLRYVTSASRNHPRYQSRSSMFIRRLIPRNFSEVPIGISRMRKSDFTSAENKLKGADCFVALAENPVSKRLTIYCGCTDRFV